MSVLIREANVKDIEGIAEIHVDCWKTTYKGIVPKEFLEKMSYINSRRIFTEIFNAETENELIYVAELDARVIGFVYAGNERNGGNSYKSELYSIYILKSYQNMKIGKKLISAVAQGFLKKV